MTRGHDRTAPARFQDSLDSATPAGSMNSYGFYRIPWIPLPPAGSMNSYGFYRIPWISAPARVPLVEMLAIPGIPAFPHFSLPEATPANGAGPTVVRPLMCWPLARASGQHIRGRTTVGPAPFAGVASGSEKCGKAGIPGIASISTRGTLAGAEIQGIL